MSRDPYAVGDIDSFQARKDEEVTQAIEKRPWIKNTKGGVPDLLSDGPEIVIEIKWNTGGTNQYSARILNNEMYWLLGSRAGFIEYWRPLDK